MTNNKLLDVKTYDELVEKLKIIGVTPKEAYSLAFKHRFNYDRRHFWTMFRITAYLRLRLNSALNLKSKYKIEIKYPKKLWALYRKEVKEEKWWNIKMTSLTSDIFDYKKKGEFSSMLHYVDPAYWGDLINSTLENEEMIKLIKTKMPKRIDTCREVVESNFAIFNYTFYPGKKMDKYLEVQNLSKLVTEKRQKNKFSPNYLDIRKVPGFDKVRWEHDVWKNADPKKLDEFHQWQKSINSEMRRSTPDYAKSMDIWKDPKREETTYVYIKEYLLKHDWYGGKVDQFKHYTQRNIDLIR